MNTKFQYLFSPLKIRDVVFPNRIFLSPQGHSPKHNHVSSYDSIYDCGMMFYDKSQGCFGAAEISYATGRIDENGEYEKLSRDRIRELQSMCSQTGAKVGVGVGGGLGISGKDDDKHEIRHYEIKPIVGTPKGRPLTINGPQGVMAERVQYRASDGIWDGASCFEMPKEMIYESIERAKISARAAVNFGGFDYVNMGGLAMGGIFCSFISDKQNHRNDEFGGSVENKARYPKMMAEAIREVVGDKMPIVATISPSIRDELAADLSHTPDEMIECLKQLAGIVDAVIVVSGMDTTNLWNSNVFHCGTIWQKKAQDLDFCIRIKKEVPGMIAINRGGMNEPEVMDEFIKNGWCDAVCVGRQFVADPYWPKKAMEGREEDITPCIRCDHCYHSATDHRMLMCSVNPRLFRERRVPVEPKLSVEPKHLIVVGGGPGGCRAAITAAEEGHRVTLIEMTDSLGGNLKHAPFDNHKVDLDRYRRYLITQIGKHENIQVIYNTKATPELVERLNPDAVLVAIGAQPIIPDIPGIEKAFEAVDIYSHQSDLGKKVVVIGGGTIGTELSVTLAENNHDVTVIEMGDELATKEHFFYKIGLQHTVYAVKENFHALIKCTVKEVKDNGVVYVDEKGDEHFIVADSVVIAAGMKSKKEEAQSFYGIVPRTTIVGDCNRVGKVLQANTEAYFFAASL